MAALDDISKALVTAPARHVRATLVRCVTLLPLTAGGTPDYLFTSGKANRYNPAGVSCVYFSENEKTARAEYARRLGRAGLQPLGTYFAEVHLAAVLDLTDAQTPQKLGFKPKDLSLNWQRSKNVRSQLLGRAVSQQNRIAAIRFPSDAARAAGFAGFNLVIFRDCVTRPDFVRVLG